MLFLSMIQGNKLLIKEINYKDRGMYFCTAYNEMGVIKRNVELKIRCLYT